MSQKIFYKVKQKYIGALNIKSNILFQIVYILMISFIILIAMQSSLYATNKKVATSDSHTVAVSTRYTVSCAGGNYVGECDVDSWRDIEQVAAGSFFSVALDVTGTVYCAGLLFYDVCDVSSLNSNGPITYIAAGENHIVAVNNVGNVYAVGDDTYGQTIVSSWNSYSDIIAVAGGSGHTLGLRTGGTVVCVGANTDHQCDVSGWSGITEISAGNTFSVGLSNGTVFYAGWNGNNLSNITSYSNIKHISAGAEHIVAVDNTGTPYAAGQNGHGQCNVDTWTVIDEIVAGTKATIGIMESGELDVIGDDPVVEDSDGWHLTNNPPDAVDASITVYEDYTVTTDNLYSLASDFESHSLTIVTGNPTATNGIVFSHGNGVYTYTPTADFNGSDSFTYTITDNQPYNPTGTAIVSISVTPVNDPPYYSISPPIGVTSTTDSITITEDYGSLTCTSWAYDLSPGAYNETAQSLYLTWTCSDESLFLTAPYFTPLTVNNSGYLTNMYLIPSNTTELSLIYQFAEDEFGSAVLSITLTDSGGTLYTAYGAHDSYTRTLTLISLSVNDPPTYTFSKGTRITVLENSGAHSFTAWATDLYEGAIHETDQTLLFVVSNNNTGLFSIQPGMAVVSDTPYTRGDLTFTLNSDVSGEVTVTVVLEDTGGTAIGGEYQVTQTFTITILPDTAHDGPGGIGDTTGLAALKLWLKADSFTDLSDGATLTTWFDNTDNGYTCTQSGSPQYVENFSNDFPAVEFDGSNYFEYNASSLDFLNSTGISIFAVVNATTSGVTNTIIARDASGNHSWACQLDPSYKLLFSVANSSSQACTRLGASSISSNYTIVSFQYDGLVDESLQVYAGETDDSDSLGYTIPYYIDGSGPALRIGNDGNGNNFVGQIAELIVFNRALGDVERVLINNYLSAKYDIALSANDKYTGDNVSAGDFDRDVAGIGLESDDSINAHAISAGMIVTSTGFVQDAGDYLLFGHNNEASPLTLTNLPFNVKSACERVWMFHKTDQSTNGGDIDIAFDLNELELSDLTLTTDFLLLRRSGSVGTFEIFNSSPTVLNNQIIFTVDTADLNTGDCLTFGSEIDYMLDFSGASDYLVSEKSVDLTNTSFTIEYWERRFSSTEMYIIGQGQNLIAGFAAANVIKFGFSDTNFVQSQGAPVDDLTNWHHHAYVYDKVTKNIQIYVDGKSVPLTSNTMTDDYTGTGLLYVGMAPSSSFKFNAYLDDVRIWSTVRTQTEIIENMNKYMDGDETNLLANWQFNEGASNITYDKTTAAIDLCLTPTNNEPTWIISDLPLGYTSASYTEQNGTLSFTDTGMTMDYNYHNGATVVVTKVVTEPASLPGGDDDLSAQYWIVTRNSDSTFNAKLTFEIDEFFNMPTQDYPEKVAKLYWREIGSQGAWEEIAYGFEINAPDSVKFESIKTSGQFMVSLDDFEPIAGSGKSLGFNGMDDCAFDETCRIDLTNTNFTIEFWAKRAIYDQTNIIIAQNDTAQGLSIGFTATNAFIFSVGSDIASTNAYTELGWHHWAVSFDNSNYTQTIYCDGEWITENTASASYDLTGIFYVGCGASQTNNYMGQLDDIRVWRTVRTQEEIQNNMFVPIQEDDEPFDLFVYWRLDDTWSYKYFSDAIKARSVNLEVTGSVQATNMWDSEAWMKRISDEDVSVTIVAGYDLEDGLDFTIYSKGMPSNGTITSDTPYIHYTPNEHYPDQVDSNIDNFMYRLFSVSGDTFLVEFTILQVNDPPEIGDIDPTITGTNESVSVSFTITDIETDADSLLITATSNDYTLVSDSNISLTCSSGNCTMTITPTANEYGTLTINFIIEDPEGLTGINAMALTINSYPEIGSIEDYTVTAFTATAAIPFTIADTETATEELSLTITSDPEIFDSSNASFSPLTPATSNTVTLTPTTNSYTVVSVSVIVTDAASYTAASTFDLYIKTLPEIEPISDYTTAVNTAQSISFKITDLDTGADSLELTITTSDTNILPLTATSYTNSSGDCTATFTPTAYGSVDITITVGDIDSNYTSTTFILNSVMSPEISSINDYTISQNTEIPSFNFTITDETNASQLTVTFSSSDESIIPSAQIVEANDGSDSYTLTITPLANKTGAVTITTLAVDSDGYSSTNSFVINIVSLPGSGNMLTFDGSNDYAKSGDTLSLSGDHTVEAWIKPDNHWDMGCVVSMGNSIGKNAKLLITDSEEFAVEILNDGGMRKSYTASTLSTGKWHHVAYSYQEDIESLTIYVNGIQITPTVGENQSISPFTLSSVPVYIGKDLEDSFFDGSIDEVRIWNDVRTEEEIRDFMCEKAYTSTTDDLVAYYRFDHDSGSTIMYDWTESGNSCDITGATLATSEAPIGDDSSFDYLGSVSTDFFVNITYGDGESFTMVVDSNVPDGIHLYSIDQAPNTTENQYRKIESDRYWGTFIIGSCTYHLEYDYVANPHAAGTKTENYLAWRNHNSDTWAYYDETDDDDGDGIIISPSNNSDRYEYILYNNLK